MKKLFVVLFLAVVFTLSACTSTEDNFDETKKITVYTRDTTSGT
jgi:protein involved in sex pheromone biosynthesis